MEIGKQQFKSYAKIQTKELGSDSSGQGIIKVSGWASKSFENGKPVIDRDFENLNTKNFELSHAKVLLYDHDWSKPIGKMALSHKPEGIWIDAEVHQAMDEKTFYAVKEGILDSFSVGFYATEAEYINVDGEDYLSFTKGGIYECSVVSIPSNTSAMIQSTSVIKSLIKDGECTGLQCSIKSLKEMNPDCGCPMEILKGKQEKNMNDREIKLIKGLGLEELNNNKPNIQTIIKALTFEETMQDSWNEKQRLNHYLEILHETISDNWYETMWSEGLAPEEAKQNILNAIDTFKTKLDEFTTLQFEPTQVEKNKREIMTKNIDETKPEAVEAVEQTPAEGTEQILEGGDDTPVEEVKENVEQTTEQVAEQKEETTVEKEVVEENVEVSENVDAPVEQSVSKPTVQTIVGTLQTINLDEVTDEEIEALYNSSAEMVEKIEALVKADISGE